MGPASNEGRKGRAINLLVKQRRCHDDSANQMMNKDDLLAHSKPNPCGDPECRSVGKTAGLIGSRLTKPKII